MTEIVPSAFSEEPANKEAVSPELQDHAVSDTGELSPSDDATQELTPVQASIENDTTVVVRQTYDSQNLESGISPKNTNAIAFDVARPARDAGRPGLMLPTGRRQDHQDELASLLEQAELTPALNLDTKHQTMRRAHHRSWGNASADPAAETFCAEAGQELMPHLTTPRGNARAGFPAMATGSSNMAKLAATMGTARSSTLPLANSLLFPFFQPLTLADMLAFYQAVTDHKSTIGRRTMGLIYANESVMVWEALANSILRKHVTFKSLRIDPPKEIAEGEDPLLLDPLHYIKITDVDPLLTMLAATYYPEGYNYERLCVHCSAIAQRHVKLQHLVQYADNRYTDAARLHLVNASTSVLSYKAVLAAQNTLPRNAGTYIDYQTGQEGCWLRIRLRIPSLAQVLTTGAAFIQWIESIVPPLDRYSDEELRQNRDRVADQARMRKRVAFIESVETHQVAPSLLGDHVSLGDDTMVSSVALTSVESQQDVCLTLSRNSDLVTMFEKAVTDLMAQAMISIVAVPAYTCPSCGKHNMPDSVASNNQWPIWLPLDPLMTFFELIELQLHKAR